MIRGSCLCGEVRFEYGRDDPGVGIAGHIYVGSKAAWDEIAGDAPRFEEGLPRPPAPKRA